MFAVPAWWVVYSLKYVWVHVSDLHQLFFSLQTCLKLSYGLLSLLLLPLSLVLAFSQLLLSLLQGHSSLLQSQLQLLNITNKHVTSHMSNSQNARWAKMVLVIFFSPGCVSLSPFCAAAPPAGLSPASAGPDSGPPVFWLPDAARAVRLAAPAEPGREKPAEPEPHPVLEYSLLQTPARKTGREEEDWTKV